MPFVRGIRHDAKARKSSPDLRVQLVSLQGVVLFVWSAVINQPT